MTTAVVGGALVRAGCSSSKERRELWRLEIEDEGDGVVNSLLLDGRQPTGKLIQALDVDGA
jgi:hypothetical protein